MAPSFNAAAHIAEAWSRAQSGWQGEAAEVFRAEYILRLQECAELLDRACGAAEEQTRLLAEELSALEAQIHT